MKKKLTSAYLSIFCTEMSVIFRAGIPLGDAVRVLLADADGDSRTVLQSILDGISSREPFSSALEKSGYFPAHIVGVVKAGEMAGRTAETLTALGEYYDRMDRLAVTVKNAVFFPLVLLAMMSGVVLILITRVLPIFSEVFGRHGSRMPPLAAALMRLGQWLSSISAVFAVIFAVILLIVCVLRFSVKIREAVFAALKKRYGGRGIMGEIASYHFITVIALCVESGLKTREAVELASAVSGGTARTDKKNAECARRLRDGETLAEAMGGAGILNAREAQMLSFGARGGATDLTLAEITRRKERGITDKIGRIIGRIEPAMIVAVCVIVGVILLSVMAPLVGIMNSIGG
ncbi:MAG: type II secretion system F family protein [Oscillospiraceae bacterium]|nr:type II secretion system F family protein [Oscillospiraceae bacterium]